MFREVVAAIDGSPASFRAAALGAQLATAAEGSMELVAVAPRKTGLLRLARPDPERERDRRQADLRSARAAIGPAAPVRDAHLVEGPVVESILSRCSDGQHAGRLVCVGSGKHRVKLGSVSASVLRQADCPVLVVREGTSRGPRLQRLLVGYDGSENSLAAVHAAAELSRRTGAGVYLVWVLRPPFPMPPQGLELEAGEMQALAGPPERQELEQAAAYVVQKGGQVARTLFDVGEPGDRMLARAEGWDVDLVVIGARSDRTAGKRRLLGGVSDRIAARSSRPVLVVR